MSFGAAEIVLLAAGVVAFAAQVVRGLIERRRFSDLRQALSANETKLVEQIKTFEITLQDLREEIRRLETGISKIPGVPASPVKVEPNFAQLSDSFASATSVQQVARSVVEVRTALEKSTAEIGGRLDVLRTAIEAGSLIKRIDSITTKVDQARAELGDASRSLATSVVHNAAELKSEIATLDGISRATQLGMVTIPSAIAEVRDTLQKMTARTEDILVRVAWYWDWTPQPRLDSGGVPPVPPSRRDAPPEALVGVKWGDEAGSAMIVGENVRRERVEIGRADGRWHDTTGKSVDVRVVTLKGDQAYRRQQVEEIADRVGFRADLDRVLDPLPQVDRMKLDMVYEFPPAAISGPLSIQGGDASDKELLQKLPRCPHGSTVQVTFDASTRTIRVRIQAGR